MAVADEPVKRWPRHPTLEDVARRAGVSRALVSLVVRGAPHVSTERRTRVESAVAELGYRPNALARSLAARRTATIGVLVHDLHNPFFADIADAVEQAAEGAGYRTLLATGRGRPDLEETALETFFQHRVGGALLVGTELPVSRLLELAGSAPLVVVSREVEGVDSVRTDDSVGMRLAVDHLVGLGHRRIGYIDSPSDPGAPSRRAGYELAMRGSGLLPLVGIGDFTEEGGALGAEVLLRLPERPTAVIAPNDLAAAGALDHLEAAGLSVPADLSLTGYDDTYIAGLRRLGLTSVGQPRRAMGAAAFDLLRGRMLGRPSRPVERVLAPSLVVRRTTGRAP
ncbi:MAG: LacI family DNA-binding transcriptional regulator [Candidatus Dormibacteraceae bacterium]